MTMTDEKTPLGGAGREAIETPASRARVRMLVASISHRSTITACTQGVAAL